MAKITSTAELDRVRAAFAKGMTIRDAARHVGISKDAIYRARDRGEIDLSDAPKGYGRKPPMLNVGVPQWVVRLGLADDYRDFARAFDEHYAARVCRRLGAEARA